MVGEVGATSGCTGAMPVLPGEIQQNLFSQNLEQTGLVRGGHMNLITAILLEHKASVRS